MKHFTYRNFFGEDDLACIRKSACKWIEPPHTHEFIEFVYVANGKGWHSIEGTRYDVGDKLGFLKATVEYALRREDLRDEFMEYLNSLKK